MMKFDAKKRKSSNVSWRCRCKTRVVVTNGPNTALPRAHHPVLRGPAAQPPRAKVPQLQHLNHPHRLLPRVPPTHFPSRNIREADTSLPGPHLLRPWLLNNASSKRNITKHKLRQPQPQSRRSNPNPHRITVNLLFLCLPRLLMYLPQL